MYRVRILWCAGWEGDRLFLVTVVEGGQGIWDFALEVLCLGSPRGPRPTDRPPLTVASWPRCGLPRVPGSGGGLFGSVGEGCAVLPVLSELCRRHHRQLGPPPPLSHTWGPATACCLSRRTCLLWSSVNWSQTSPVLWWQVSFTEHSVPEARPRRGPCQWPPCSLGPRFVSPSMLGWPLGSSCLLPAGIPRLQVLVAEPLRGQAFPRLLGASLGHGQRFEAAPGCFAQRLHRPHPPPPSPAVSEGPLLRSLRRLAVFSPCQRPGGGGGSSPCFGFAFP